jgi:hypothetical protein
MSIRAISSATVFAGLAAAMLCSAGAGAQESLTEAEVEAVTEGRQDRYSLVEVDGDVLRVDRQNGTVSVCREQSETWRCSPVPLAEDAYLAEIGELAAEVDRLTVRLEELEGEGGEPESRLPPGSALDRKPKGTGPDGRTPLLDEEAEEDLEKVLTFTESAMRRFFGMVRDLQKTFEDEDAGTAEGEGGGN